MVPALRRDRPETHSLLSAVARLHVRGVAVTWPAVIGQDTAHRVDLPTYPFQRQRYWLHPTTTSTPGDPAAGDASTLGLDTVEHPLLGAAVALADSDTLVFTGWLFLATHPRLADHTGARTALLPGTAFVELALAAGGRVGCGHVDELTLAAPLVLPEQERGGVRIQLTVGAADSRARRPVSFYSAPDDTGEAIDAPGQGMRGPGPLAMRGPGPLAMRGPGPLAMRWSGC